MRYLETRLDKVYSSLTKETDTGHAACMCGLSKHMGCMGK